MKKQILLSAVGVSLIGLGMAGSADAALLSRLGGLAYYDDVANLTWLADANYAQTSGYAAMNANGLGNNTNNITITGLMGWQAAKDWAAQLTVGGVSGWRLPDTIDVGNDGLTYQNGNIYTGVDAGYNMTTHSELSNLYYNVLGNLAYYDTSGNTGQAGWGLQNTGPFSNVQGPYWSATQRALYTPRAWFFNMSDGLQLIATTRNSEYGWAVQSGDVSAVPIPAAVWLFGSGLLGLVGVARRKSANA